jgi:hypothetical protein
MKKKHFVLTALLLLLMGIGHVRASDTRLRSLGYLTNYYIRDNFNIWLFPSNLVDYRKLIFFESSYPGMDSQLWRGGIHLLTGRNFILGVYLENSRQTIMASDTQFNNAWDPDLFYTYRGLINRQIIYPGLNSNEASHQLTVLGGLKMQNFDIGLFVTTYSSRLTFTDPDTSSHDFEDKLGSWDAALGISFKMNPRSRFDGTIFYGSSSFSHFVSINEPTIQIEPYGYSRYGVHARMFFALTPKAILVPFVSYRHMGWGYRSVSSSALVQTDKSSSNIYILACALDLIPFQNTLIALATGYYGADMTYNEMTFSQGTPPIPGKSSYQALPFLTLGLEARIAKWMGVRLSAWELLETYTDQQRVTNALLYDATLTGSDFNARFGLYFILGRFTLDVLVDHNGAADFLHNGPYLLSGRDYSESGLFTQVSITYNYQE